MGYFICIWFNSTTMLLIMLCFDHNSCNVASCNQQIWAEIGESEGEKNKVLLDIERECLEVYRRKVDDANRTRVQLHQSVAAKEAEVASLMATLGEHKLYMKVYNHTW